MYKMNTFALFTAEAWKKNEVEVIEYGGEIWINQKHLDIANIADRIQYYFSEFKNTLAVEITINSVKTKATIFRDKFAVNQHDKVLRKQQSLDLRLKKVFPNEEIIEEYSALHYRNDFTFKKHILVVKNDQKGHVDRYPDYKKTKRIKKSWLIPY